MVALSKGWLSGSTDHVASLPLGSGLQRSSAKGCIEATTSDRDRGIAMEIDRAWDGITLCSAVVIQRRQNRVVSIVDRKSWGPAGTNHILGSVKNHDQIRTRD
ncbi:hypothetical protein VB716_03140 [Synechococcus sp. CCY9201]|nr:hypothetical protein [Synechococcus sp. CCY9201]